jgi:hypothetical protein
MKFRSSLPAALPSEHPATTRHFFQTLTGKILVTALLVAVADGLFFGHPIGWTAALFGALLFIALQVSHRDMFTQRRLKIIGLLTLLLLFPLIEAPGLLSVGLFCLGLVSLVVLKRRVRAEAEVWIADLLRQVGAGLFQFFADIGKLERLRAKKRSRPFLSASLAHLALPAVLCLAFIGFFTMANPLLERAMSRFEWRLVLPALSFWRIEFWFVATLVLWSLMRPRVKPVARAQLAQPPANLDFWLSRNSVIASLVVFNAIFAAQNAMDAAFLWSGSALPEGLTYAAYAQAGAYPLIVTALLAASYVLLIFREDQQKYQSAAARKLVYLWIAQNVFLVASAINRNLHYIEAYSLTWLRLAALIWMGLVALGLLLIVARLYRDRSNRWLLDMNTLALLTTLYASCFVNFERIIAFYNAGHSYEATGLENRPKLDLGYINSLGPEALPALRWLQENGARLEARPEISSHILSLKNRVEKPMEWREWTWRRHRAQLREAAIADAGAVVPVTPPAP